MDVGNPNYSSLDGVLFDKSQTLLIQHPGGSGGSYAIPSSVTSISSGAFNGCSGLTSVTIPASVTNIKNYAFRNCGSLVSACFDPNNPLAGMPQPVLGPGTLSMTFHAAAPGVTYGAETSIDLQNWSALGVTLSDLDPANMRTATVDRDAPRRFLRLTFGMSP